MLLPPGFFSPIFGSCDREGEIEVCVCGCVDVSVWCFVRECEGGVRVYVHAVVLVWGRNV